MSEKRGLLDALGVTIKEAWSIDGVVRIDSLEDQQNYQLFLEKNPDFREAMLERVRARQEDRDAYNLSKERPEVVERMRMIREIIDAPRPANEPAASASVASPMRMAQAIDAFVESKSNSTENNSRTLQDKRRLLRALCVHLAAQFAGLGADPWVHEIERRHIESFFNSMRVRRHLSAAGTSDEDSFVAPGTVLKKISDVRSFFVYALAVQATASDPTDKLSERTKALKSRKSRQKSSYKPFTDNHLRKMFAPAAHLAFNRDADYFWAPLIGLHLGCSSVSFCSSASSSFSRAALSLRGRASPTAGARRP